MGNCVGGFKKYTKKRTSPFCKKRKICLCILGIDGVGKSTIVKALANEDITKVLPTNGFTFCKIDYNAVKIVFYDLGGGERIRDIWSNYYSETYGVIFVVDGTDTEHIEDNKRLLGNVISNSDLSSKPLLLLINKKDQNGCLNEIQLSDKLGLHELAERHRTQIRVECCSAIHGAGKDIDPSISDGIDWLLDRILERYSSLAKRVIEAEERLKVRQKEDRLNRLHRLVTAKTYENSTEEEKQKFTEKLMNGYTETGIVTVSKDVVKYTDRPIERISQLCKFSKPRVVPLHGGQIVRQQRSASDSALHGNNKIPLVRGIVVPLFRPLKFTGVPANEVSSDDSSQFRRRHKHRRSKNQVNPLHGINATSSASNSSNS